MIHRLFSILQYVFNRSARLCGRSFRTHFREELEASYRRRRKDLLEREGRSSALRFCWTSQFDLLSVAVDTRREELRTWKQRKRRAHDVPSSGKGNPMKDLTRDIQFACRMLLRAPGLTLIMLITLTLGIGVNTIVFTGVNTTLLSRLPAVSPDQLVYIFPRDRRTGRFWTRFSYPNYRDYLDQSESFQGIVLSQMHRAAVSIGEVAEIQFGERVSENYFSVLGARAALGRVFYPGEEALADPIVVIGHSLWRERFGSDPEVIGTIVKLDDKSFTVSGVMPPEFNGTEFGLQMDFWLPLSQATQDQYPGIRDEMVERDWENYDPPIARLREDVTLEEAQAELDVISKRLEKRYPEFLKDQDVRISEAIGPPIDPGQSRIGRFSGWLALGLVGLVLLIACANVAALLLSRASARRKEISVRAALGAGRMRLLRQLLTESLLLSASGGILALLIAYWGSARVWSSLLPHLQYKWAMSFEPDGRVLFFTAALSIMTGVIFGLFPALRILRSNLVDALKTGAGAGQFTAKGVLGRSLVVGQVAVSFLLLTISGLFLTSLMNSRNIDTGFKTDELLLMSIDIGSQQLEREAGRNLYREVRERVAALPGVHSVSMTHNIPLDDRGSGLSVWVDAAELRREDGVGAEFYLVDPGLFEAMEIPIQRGRPFTRQDGSDDPPVAIVSETLARRLWPDSSALGMRIRLDDGSRPAREVVGVVPDLKHHNLWEESRPAVFTPLSQGFSSMMALVVRVRDEPGALVAPIRELVREIDPRIPVFDIKTIQQHMSYSLWLPRMGANLAALFGALALSLAAVGLHGVISQSVAMRTREIGIRMAVGASRRDVVRLVTRQSLRLVVIGGLLGAFLAATGSSLLQSVLFGIDGIAWNVLGAVALTLIVVALLASYLPVRRAASIDPNRTLRFE